MAERCPGGLYIAHRQPGGRQMEVLKKNWLRTDMACYGCVQHTYHKRRACQHRRMLSSHRERETVTLGLQKLLDPVAQQQKMVTILLG
jgi:hypothetical protein